MSHSQRLSDCFCSPEMSVFIGMNGVGCYSICFLTPTGISGTNYLEHIIVTPIASFYVI